MSILGLLLTISVLVNITPVQNFLVRQVSHKLSKQLHAKVEVDHVDFKLFNRFLIEGAYVADEQGDTLLYTKSLTVNVTNFFFLKDKTVLYYLGLKDAVINLRRTPGDSVWNYQFIVDAFSNPKKKKDKKLPNIFLRKIKLENIHINQIDGWRGKDMHISVGEIAIDAKTVALRKHKIQINSIELKNPLLVLEKYDRTEPIDSFSNTAMANAPPLITDSSVLQWNTQHWQIQVDKINLHDGGFTLINKGKPPSKNDFDPSHIRFYDIDGTLKNVRFVKDSLISRVDLTARESSGLEVKKLQGRFKLSPVTIEVSDLDLATNHSHLKNYFALQFDHFDDLSDFTTKVTMRGDFHNTSVSSDDIGIFADPLKAWKKDFHIDGLAYGTLDQLTGENMHIQAGKNTTLVGSISMTGLPDIDNTFIDFQSKKLITNGRDILQIVPTLKQNKKISLDALTYLKFQGSYVGFIYDFVSYGTFTTNLGNFKSDINLKFGPQHKVPSYSGNLSSNGFDIGSLLHQKKLGKIAFQAKIKGKGFTLKNINTSVDGSIKQLTFNNYNYHHIQLNGDLKQKLFQGQVAVADSNLTLDFQGKIDFNDSIPSFSFNSDIQKSNLRALHLTKDSILFSGKLGLNFSGNNPDNFLGEARLYDINLYKNKTRVAFDTLIVNAFLDNKSEKWLTLRGNEVSGYLHGKYDLTKLPDVALLFLNKYFPNKIKAPNHKNLNQQMEFSFQFGNLDSILNSFVPDIKNLKNGQLTGKIDTKQDSLALNFNIDHLGYKHYNINDIRVHSIGTSVGLKNKALIGNVYLKDSLVLPETTIETFSHQDSSLITLNTVGNTALNKANLKLQFILLKDGYYAKILNSIFYINNKDWHISPGNEILLKRNNIRIHNFNIFHSNQSITLTSANTPTDSANAFSVHLNNLYIEDFSRFFLPDISMEGKVNGQFSITNPLDTMHITGTVKTSQFSLNNDSLGSVTATSTYNQATQSIEWDVHKTDQPDKGFEMKGLVGVGNNKKLQGDFDFNHTDVSFLSKILTGYVSDLEGNITGQLTLSGNKNHPEVNGSLKIKDMGFIVDYTKVYYTINDDVVTFSPGKIDIGSITLKDKEGRTGILSGTITHRNFKDIFFHIDLNTQALQLINTTEKDNPQYYGNVVGSGRVDFSGPLSNLQMIINVSPLSETHVYLPLPDEEDIGKHDFIVFKKYGKALEPPKDRKDKVNLTVKLFANMNPQAQIDVIVDANSGDHIEARGNGALQINVNLNGEFQMYGNYSITEGSYIFSFKSLLSRKFAINRGSAISWDGDPSNANINITAIYHVPGGTNLQNLITGDASTTLDLSKEDRRLLRQREDIDVYLFLKNSLMHPDISYDIRIPDASISISSLVMTKLQQIRQNPNTLINQVAALLAAGQFIPVTSDNASSDILRSGGISSAGQWVSSQLTGVLNNLFGNQLNDIGMSFSMNYNNYSASGNYGDIQRNDVQFNVSKNLFDNRVQLKVGPSINWGRSNTPQAANSSYFAGDFRLEYLITPDGRVRFLAFSRSNYNVLLNHNLTRAGIGIAYSRQFDYLHELFRSKEEKRRLDSLKNEQFKKYLEESNERNPITPIPTDSTSSPQKLPVNKEEEEK